MLEAEKLNLKKAYKRVDENLAALLNSDKEIKDIFGITFSKPTFTLFNLVKWNSLTEVSYGDAKKKIISFAKYFSENISNDEKYVGLLLENLPEWIYSFYGLLMSGFVPVLLSTKNANEENKEILEELKSNTIVGAYSIKFGAINTINAFDIADYDGEVTEKWANEVVFITSGTSGKSKIIKYTGEELCKQIENAAGIIHNYPSIASTHNGYLKHLLILPLYHVFGFIAVFLWFSFFNITFVIPSSLDSDKIKEACLIAEPTHIFAVPLFWDTVAKKINNVVKAKKAEKKFEKGISASITIQKLLPHYGAGLVRNKLFAKYLDNIFGRSIKFCITGGSQISVNTLKTINGLGYPLVNGYGSTEIGISSFASPKCINTRMSDQIGIPFDNFEYQINENNELLVKGKSSYRAILKDGEWVERNKDEFIETFDAAKVDKKHYYLNGRLDEIFVDNNGENYSLPKLEQSILTSYAQDVVVIPEKNAKSLSILVSFGENTADFYINKDLVQIVTSSAYKQTKFKNIYVVKHDVPKANGLKIKRNLLTEMLHGENDFEKVDISKLKIVDEKVECDEQLLKEVMTKFAQVTECYEINKNSDFFVDLGGDSLSYYELLSKIEGNFGVKINLEEGIIRTPLQMTLVIMEKM